MSLTLLETQPNDGARIINLIDNLNLELTAMKAKYDYTVALLEQLRQSKVRKPEPQPVAQPVELMQYDGIDDFLDNHYSISNRTKVSDVTRMIKQLTGVKKLRPELEEEIKNNSKHYKFVNIHNKAFIEPI